MRGVTHRLKPFNVAKARDVFTSPIASRLQIFSASANSRVVNLTFSLLAKRLENLRCVESGRGPTSSFARRPPQPAFFLILLRKAGDSEPASAKAHFANLGDAAHDPAAPPERNDDGKDHRPKAQRVLKQRCKSAFKDVEVHHHNPGGRDKMRHRLHKHPEHQG